MQSEHSALSTQWLLCTSPWPPFAHSRTLCFVFRVAWLECIFIYWDRRLYRFHFSLRQSTFLVNNACSPCKGQCQQGYEEDVLFGVLYEHALTYVCVLFYGIHNKRQGLGYLCLAKLWQGWPGLLVWDISFPLLFLHLFPPPREWSNVRSISASGADIYKHIVLIFFTC